MFTNSTVKSIQSITNEELQKDIPLSASWNSKVNQYNNILTLIKKKIVF